MTSQFLRLLFHGRVLLLLSTCNSLIFFTIGYRSGECLNYGLGFWNASLRRNHILYVSCCRYIQIVLLCVGFFLLCWLMWIGDTHTCMHTWKYLNVVLTLCFPLQLPSPQLEGALKKFSSLRSPLAAYANQPSIKTSLPRYKLVRTIRNLLVWNLYYF